MLGTRGQCLYGTRRSWTDVPTTGLAVQGHGSTSPPSRCWIRSIFAVIRASAALSKVCWIRGVTQRNHSVPQFSQGRHEMKPTLTTSLLQAEAARFAEAESKHDESSLFGVTDGKAVGTYLEHKFQRKLKTMYHYEKGSSAKGIDFLGLNVDLKVTSIKQPQSSSPFKSARQKVLGLGYSLLVFVYRKTDDANKRTARLQIIHTIFVDASRTADYQTTRGIREILDRDGNVFDLMAFMADRNLPIDDISAKQLAEEILENPPLIGYLTISNALQWRLQYSRVIERAGSIAGIRRVSQS